MTVPVVVEVAGVNTIVTGVAVEITVLPGVTVILVIIAVAAWAGNNPEAMVPIRDTEASIERSLEAFFIYYKNKII
jgi:hypothetical protein